MGIFNRQTAEQITQKMIDWTRGVTQSLTDFRAGSKVRTIYEAVAVVLEDFFDKTFKAVKSAIQQNLYTAFGFTPLPAISASGSVRLYAQNPPTSDQPFYIPAGTQVQASPTSSQGPLTFQTLQDSYVYANSPKETGAVTINGKSVTNWYYVDVPVVCLTAGVVGNVGSNTIQTLVGAPSGIGAATNPAAFTTGAEAETLSQQKARFQSFMSSRTRGTMDAIEYGASTAVVMDSTGTLIQERVVSAIGVNGSGSFSVYLWNGVGTASTNLISAAEKIVDGYTDANGNRVWGYKPAGISYTMASVTVTPVTLAMTITPASGYAVTDADVSAGLIDIRPAITNAVSNFFSALVPGKTLVWSELSAVVAAVTGVYDANVTAPAANKTAANTEILTASLPITFTKGTTV